MNHQKSERKIGIVQILLSGFCFGFLGVFGKMAYSQGLQPGELLSLRFLMGGTLLLAVLLVTRPRKLKIPAKDILLCAGLGLFGYAVFSSCFFQALKGLSASLTVLLLYTYPLQVAAAAWFFFGEKISRDRWIALPLVMLGLVMLIWGDFAVLNQSALWFGFASAFFYSIYILLSSQWLKSIDALVSVTYIQLAAGLGLGILHLRDAGRLQEIFVHNWLLLLAVAVICSAAAMSLFLAGLKRLKNWEASVLSTAEPVTGVLLAILILNESFSWIQAGGALAILGAFILVAIPKRGF